MTQTWKKIATVSLAAVMLTGSLAGCGKKAVSIDKENPSINVMTKAYNTESASPDSPVLQKLEEFLGTKLNITWVPSTSYDEKVTAAMGSGEYPQVMLVGSRSSSVIQNSRAGTFWDVTDKLTDAEKFPNLAQTDPTVNHNTSIDGKVYGVYRSRELGRAGVSIRKDWLDKLGLEQPKTIDDFYNVLKAFKEQDPNGNGEADEIPYTTRNTQAGVLAFMEAFGISGFEANEQFFIEDGQVKYAYTDPRCKEALEFINKLYSEGLIDSEYATNDTNVWLSRLTNEVSGACQDTTARAYSLGTQVRAANADSDAYFVVVAPPKGPDGTQMTTSQMQAIRGFTAISADSPYIKEIVQLFDYFYSEEGSLLMNFGIEGETYTMENGKPTYTENIANDSQGRSILSMLNIYGHREWAYKQDIGYEDALLDETYVNYRNDMEQYIRPTIPALSFTEEEREVINSTYTEIQTYKDEMINKFIMGKEPLDNFDSFVQTLKNMGIDDVLAVEQAAYDRYVK